MRKKTTHLENGIRAKAVVGTAGHIDHGKTTLVKTITGIDTDRLGEEKARGISIELGFAFLPTDTGRIAIIDVPGHERFVRQMIAGAAGIDLVLLVVAADEGVMPQTLEHLDICNLLGVRHGAVVLTKTDLVDDEWLALVKEDVAEQLQGSFLEGCHQANTRVGGSRSCGSAGNLAPSRQAIQTIRRPSVQYARLRYSRDRYNGKRKCIRRRCR